VFFGHSSVSNDCVSVADRIAGKLDRLLNSVPTQSPWSIGWRVLSLLRGGRNCTAISRIRKPWVVGRSSSTHQTLQNTPERYSSTYLPTYLTPKWREQKIAPSRNTKISTASRARIHYSNYTSSTTARQQVPHRYYTHGKSTVARSNPPPPPLLSTTKCLGKMWAPKRNKHKSR
jgi:hypothetical protein